MKKGITYAVLSYLAWGFLPLYWRLFQTMPAWEILGHRILWAFVFVAVLVTFSRQWKRLKTIFASTRSTMAVILCSFFISMNWLLFIWAVNNDHVLETSLGYYMNPLISVLFAVLFLKEKLSAGQWLSILLAGTGVGIMAVQFGQVPWVAIALAVSFSLYGLAKKLAGLDVLLSLTGETLIALPVALGYLIYIQSQGNAAFTSLPPLLMTVLLFAGAATALPLFWFAKSMQLLPLSLVGFIQYISPTTSLLLAVFLLGEPFSPGKLISFAFIWVALIVYSAASFRKPKLPAAQAPLESTPMNTL